MWFKIAFRNTFRNKRRTALNICMIAGGVAGIILFRGFAHHILVDLQTVTIDTQTGHLQIATPIYWDHTAKKPKQALLPHYLPLVERLKKIPHVNYATGRLSFYGLISVGDQSLSAQGLSLDPLAEKDKSAALKMIAGERLAPDNPHQVIIGSALAKRLGVKPSDSVTVLTYTFDGMMNAIDLEVAGIFTTNVTEIDETTFIMPLSSVSTLLDTDKVEKIVVGLDDTRNTDLVMGDVKRMLAETEPGVVAKSWVELAGFYRQAESFFHTQNEIIEAIILALVLLGVLNTIGMSVFERAGEIGTLRALGERDQIVLYQFLLEGAVLGFIGAIAGVLWGTLWAKIITAMHIPIAVPGATNALSVHIALFPSAFVEAVALALCAATFAALVPACRASRMNIAEALKRNV